jgi:L-asparaginase II
MPENERPRPDRPLAESLQHGAGAPPTDPAVIEVTRGAMVESRHLAAIAVVDAKGKVVMAAGDIEMPIFPRSAVKPIQALTLIETGAADAFDLGDAEIALACASHGGEAAQVGAVLDWLARIGCNEDDLECGPHPPLVEAANQALIREGRAPSAVHNNCSGNHAGFLSVARHLGDDIKGYIGLTHPVQQRAFGILEQMTGLDLAGAPRGIDGCGIPVIGVGLGNLALAMARFADTAELPEPRRQAVARICAAMAAEPKMAGAAGRFTTRVLEAAGDKVLVKGGAEGVYVAALLELGLGIAIKVDDGAKRASETVMAYLLRRFEVLDDETMESLGDLQEPRVLNFEGREVGRIRMSAKPPI